MKAILILLITIVSPIYIVGQQWDYPIKPNSKEWKELNSNQEKVKVCQLPDNVLKKTKTSDLLEICLNYPLLSDIYAFNDIYIGVNKLFSDFNGIRELYSRSDLLPVLLNKQKQIINVSSLLDKDETLIAKGKYILSISTMEVLLSLAELQDRLNIEDQKTVIETLVQSYELKKLKPKFFTGIGFKTNILSRARIIAKIENTIFDSKGIYNEEFINKLDEKSYEIIKKNN